MPTRRQVCFIERIRPVASAGAADLPDLQPVGVDGVVFLALAPFSGEDQIIPTVGRDLDRKADRVPLLRKLRSGPSAGGNRVLHDPVAARERRVLRLIDPGRRGGAGQEQGGKGSEERAQKSGGDPGTPRARLDTILQGSSPLSRI